MSTNTPAEWQIALKVGDYINNANNEVTRREASILKSVTPQIVEQHRDMFQLITNKDN